MKEERRARLMIGLGTVVMLLGILLAVNDDDTGRFLVLGGLVLLFLALHRFGRLGPDHGASA